MNPQTIGMPSKKLPCVAFLSEYTSQEQKHLRHGLFGLAGRLRQVLNRLLTDLTSYSLRTSYHIEAGVSTAVPAAVGGSP